MNIKQEYFLLPDHQPVEKKIFSYFLIFKNRQKRDQSANVTKFIESINIFMKL